MSYYVTRRNQRGVWIVDTSDLVEEFVSYEDLANKVWLKIPVDGVYMLYDKVVGMHPPDRVDNKLKLLKGIDAEVVDGGLLRYCSAGDKKSVMLSDICTGILEGALNAGSWGTYCFSKPLKLLGDIFADYRVEGTDAPKASVNFSAVEDLDYLYDLYDLFFKGEIDMARIELLTSLCRDLDGRGLTFLEFLRFDSEYVQSILPRMPFYKLQTGDTDVKLLKYLRRVFKDLPDDCLKPDSDDTETRAFKLKYNTILRNVHKTDFKKFIFECTILHELVECFVKPEYVVKYELAFCYVSSFCTAIVDRYDMDMLDYQIYDVITRSWQDIMRRITECTI